METLRNGSRGDAVATLQKKLFGKGINPGSADGVFGPKTEEAVRRYQEQQGLQVDGIAGPETFTSLGMMKTEAAEPKDETETAVEATAGAMKDAGEEVAAKPPKRGFKAKINAMRDARKAKGAR